MYPILTIRRALCRGDIFTLVRAHGHSRAQAGAGAGVGDHFTVTADGGSSVLTTAPVSAGTPHTLDISIHCIYTRYIYLLYTTLHWSHCHRKLGLRDTFA